MKLSKKRLSNILESVLGVWQNRAIIVGSTLQMVKASKFDLADGKSLEDERNEREGYIDS